MGAAFSRVVFLLIAGGLLSGCVTRSGFDYAAVMQKVGPPPPGQARIVVMSEKAMGVAATNCDLKIDGVETSTLSAGHYVYLDRPAGRHEIVATQTLFPGETRRAITTVPGRTYFFLARHSERAKTMVGVTMLGGLAGALVAAAATSGSENPGPVDLHPLEETAARTTIAELQLAK